MGLGVDLHVFRIVLQAMQRLTVVFNAGDLGDDQAGMMFTGGAAPQVLSWILPAAADHAVLGCACCRGPGRTEGVSSGR